MYIENFKPEWRHRRCLDVFIVEFLTWKCSVNLHGLQKKTPEAESLLW